MSKFKSVLKQIPLLPVFYRSIRLGFFKVREFFWVTQLRLRSRPFQPNKSANLIVSLTSFPARIDHAWIAIESIFQQDLRPSKVVLVLSDEEFPTRELPKRIQLQVQRGLEILWTPRNTRSFQKLLPTRQRYPDATIVTVDDDILYEPWRLRRLVETAETRPGSIIGHRGWVVTKTPSGLAPYVSWSIAGPETPAELTFLTGCGGMLFPPHVLPLDMLLNIDLALELCPLADDIWFWAVARKAGVECYCLGNHGLYSVQRVKHTPALCHSNWGEGQNDVQLAAVIAHFGLSQSIKPT